MCVCEPLHVTELEPFCLVMSKWPRILRESRESGSALNISSRPVKTNSVCVLQCCEVHDISSYSSSKTLKTDSLLKTGNSCQFHNQVFIEIAVLFTCASFQALKHNGLHGTNEWRSAHWLCYSNEPPRCLQSLGFEWTAKVCAIFIYFKTNICFNITHINLSCSTLETASDENLKIFSAIDQGASYVCLNIMLCFGFPIAWYSAYACVILSRWCACTEAIAQVQWCL